MLQPAAAATTRIRLKFEFEIFITPQNSLDDALEYESGIQCKIFPRMCVVVLTMTTSHNQPPLLIFAILIVARVLTLRVINTRENVLF